MNWITYLFIKLGLLEIVDKINIKEKITSEDYLIENNSFVPSDP